jgi:hypothetical protein
MTKRNTSSLPPAPPTAPAENFHAALPARMGLCTEIRDAVLSILQEEERNPVWSDSGERYAIRYEQEQELEELLTTHLTLKRFNSNELPHAVKLALADLKTYQERPKGALFRLLAETIEVAGPAVME